MAGIYIHIPFCKKACLYCNFHFSTQTQHIDAFLEALLIEIELRKDYVSTPIQTIYFGGGTPSLLSSIQLHKIMNALKKHFVLHESIEFSLEANPDDINNEQLKLWKQLGVNRLSIGIQSFQNDALSWMNRAHEVGQSHQAIQSAQKAGFENISIDLIYGTPHYTKDQLLADLNLIKAYAIPHVSCYALTVEEKTALHSMIQKGQISNVVNEEQAAHFEIIVDFLQEHGFEHYEISNFAKPGSRSQHNSSYWKGIEYLGLGPSAHSYNGSTRQWNIANNAAYIKSIEEDKVPFEKEVLTPVQQINEKIMTALRTDLGLVLKEVATHELTILKAAQSNLQSGHLILENNTLQLTREGKCLADGIAAALFVE